MKFQRESPLNTCNIRGNRFSPRAPKFMQKKLKRLRHTAVVPRTSARYRHVLFRRPPLAEGCARSDMGEHRSLETCALIVPAAVELPLPRAATGFFQTTLHPLHLHPSSLQILAHQPKRAARMNRNKSAKLSVADACNTIMEPPSPLVRCCCPRASPVRSANSERDQ